MRRSGHHVLIAVPTRGQVAWQTATALAAAVAYTPGLRPILYEPGNLSVALTRNTIVGKFLETDCETLIMVDDDIAPTVNVVEMLDPWLRDYAMVSLPHATTHPDFPGDLLLTAYDWADGGVTPHPILNVGINEVDCVATGCVAIGREPLERLGPAPFRMAHDPTDMLRSDDFLFCRDLRDNGYRVGCFWDGTQVDHFRVTNLADTLKLHLDVQRQTAGRST